MGALYQTTSAKAAEARVVHSLPGRVRFFVPGLEGNRLMARGIVKRMAPITGVCQVQANPLTGRVLVVFDPGRVREDILLKVINNPPAVPDPGVPERPGNHRGEAGKGRQEPEDLPIKRQLFNVALGGGVLAYLGLKHLLVGRTPLAGHPQLFNLAAVTTIIAGYPVFRSGLQGLAKGRINHDLVMGALALGTTLARESIPGLMVIWLTNLTALGQSLVLQGYRSALPAVPEIAGRPVQRPEEPGTPDWKEAGEEYSRKTVLPVLGLASLSGLTARAGGFQRTLAMLLAANPSPAGLAAPTAATAAMAGAGKNGILYRDAHTLEMVSKVDTVVFNGAGALSEASHQVGDILPMPGMSKTKLLSMAARACGPGDGLYGRMLQKALAVRRQPPVSPEPDPDQTERVLVGDEKALIDAGIETKWGVYKARRLHHLAQIPVFVASNGRLAGLIGLKRRGAGDTRGLVNGLRARGIRNIIFAVEQESAALRQAAREWGINQIWTDVSAEAAAERVRNLKRQGRRVAVMLGETCDTPVLKEADVGICTAAKLDHNPVDVIIAHPFLLPEVFSTALRGEWKAKQNLALVQAANAVGLALGAAGWLPPMAAKVYNNVIAVAVGANSFRLLSGRGRRSEMRPGALRGVEQEIAATFEYVLQAPVPRRQDGFQQAGRSNWHMLKADEALRRLKTDFEKGLEDQDVLQRLKVYGPNKMLEKKTRGFLSRVWGQLKDFLVKALMASAVVCAALGEFGEALAIAAILAVNALLGAVQEQKAEGSLQALAEMTAPTARVRRAGRVERIPAADLVPGDIALLEQGDGVPADLRILEANCLEIEESALTGESYPVSKNAGPMTGCVPLLDCKNLAFMGTNVTRGRGAGLVIATGMSTEIGKIAGMMDHQERGPTPLQNRMADVGGVILKYCLGVSALVVLAGVLRGGSLFQMFLTGVSLAVAAIPEGLPAVVTIALASGVRRMAVEAAVVRNLSSVETLGSTTLICTDKTGTLTQNRQLVQSVFTGSGGWQARPAGHPLKPAERECGPEDLVALLTAGILCNDANLKESHGKPAQGDSPAWLVEGDPTEGALLLAGLGEGLSYQEIRQKWRRVRELPFDAERLRMTVLCRDENHGHAVFMKGAPEVVLDLCKQIQANGQTVPLDAVMRGKIVKANERLTGEAMRVLAVAYRPVHDPDTGHPEQSLIFLGLVGMVDPPRPEVREAVAACHRAGIKVVMITGDHPSTALAIAKKVGISYNQKALTGQEIDRLNDLELATAVRQVRVFARVLPAHKLRLVKAFRRRGEILAMVGDGINDAPAVKEGDIGVAMGLAGTDVTKQAADIVLADDNFATLVSAVEQGRGIYSNIRRSARYLLSTNVGLVFLVFTAVLFGLPMPLLPIQLLFLNVLGDGLPALALGVEPPAGDLMDRPPRPADQSFFADGLGNQIISRGLATGLVGLETYRGVLKQGDLGRARTVAMTSFAASKLLFALECGEKKEGGGNRYLAGSVVLSSLLLAGAVYLPFGRRLFKTGRLSLKDVSTVLGASGLTYIVEKVITTFLDSKKTELLKEKTESCPG